MWIVKDSVDRIQLPVSAKSGGRVSKSALAKQKPVAVTEKQQKKREEEAVHLGGCGCNVGWPANSYLSLFSALKRTNGKPAPKDWNYSKPVMNLKKNRFRVLKEWWSPRWNQALEHWFLQPLSRRSSPHNPPSSENIFGYKEEWGEEGEGKRAFSVRGGKGGV